MGGVVSTGRDNDDLVDNLKEAEYIKSEKVEQVFRIVDRAHYYLPECRESAYKDLAWKSGTLHLSAPCIYSEVMEALELKKGLSFLNLGSGTGYLNTMVGFMIGPYGINHGIELHPHNVNYAEQRLKEFAETSPKFDDLELCEPVFVNGNCLNLAPYNRRYDRVYCGAACPSELISAVQKMIKIQGILVVPVGDQLLKIKRLSETDFASENVLPVSFASLVEPSGSKDVQDLLMLPEVKPMSLQDICRICIRESIRSTFTFDKQPSKNSDEASKQNKILHTSRVFRQERGRYPLNFLPTTQGLMLMGAFTDDSDASDGSDQLDSGILDRQLREHALGRRQNVDTADVDSNISDDENKSEPEVAEEKIKSEVNFDKYLRSACEKLESVESEDGIVADDEGDEDEMEMEDMSDKKSQLEQDAEDEKEVCSLKKEVISKSSSSASPKNGNAKSSKRIKVRTIERRTWVEARESVKPPENRTSLSSDDDVIVPEANANSSSSAIQMHALDSNTRTIKTSYSTSAETSETSGFGSLGDDQIQIGSVHSGLSNLEDDLVEDKSDKSSSGAHMVSISAPGNLDNPRAVLHFSDDSDSSEDAETANDEDDDDDNDNAEEEAWMYIDDDDHIDYKKTTQKSKKRKENRNVSDKSATSESVDKDEDTVNGEEVIPPPPPPSGFTVFLKKQVDTLPIPSTMKSYICHFR